MTTREDLEHQERVQLRDAEKALEAFRAAATALRDARAMPESNDWHATYQREEAIEAACAGLEELVA